MPAYALHNYCYEYTKWHIYDTIFRCLMLFEFISFIYLSLPIRLHLYNLYLYLYLDINITIAIFVVYFYFYFYLMFTKHYLCLLSAECCCNRFCGSASIIIIIIIIIWYFLKVPLISFVCVQLHCYTLDVTVYAFNF